MILSKVVGPEKFKFSVIASSETGSDSKPG